MAFDKKILDPIKHFLIGLALTLKGIDKIGHHAVIGSIILGFGIIILACFVYLLITKRASSRFDLVLHWFEGIASLFTAYIYYDEGSKYLHYVFLLAAIGFFISVYMHSRKHR
ncbi:MAG: hypothetical protein K0Q66_7 [Chitinophagaceae bacterium]|jgi:hypothetical protein|nr:hypothetical protein [Chitinophagaceae bacterium]